MLNHILKKNKKNNIYDLSCKSVSYKVNTILFSNNMVRIRDSRGFWSVGWEERCFFSRVPFSGHRSHPWLWTRIWCLFDWCVVWSDKRPNRRIWPESESIWGSEIGSTRNTYSRPTSASGRESSYDRPERSRTWRAVKCP